MVRTIRAGKVVEKSIFPVGRGTKPRAKRKKGSTPPRKRDQNDRDACRRLARTLNCNFGPGDIWVTLTYSPERMRRLLERIAKDGLEATPDTVRKYAIAERDRFLRRVKREMDRIGLKLKYIASTSDTDGQTGELVRVHHHLVVQKEAFDFLFKHWSREEVNYRPLRDQDDYTPIAEYIIRQVRRQPDEKKYTCSRNMKKPEVTERIVRVWRELRPPAGAKLLHRGEYDEAAAYQYIRYVVPPAERGKAGHGRRRE